MTDKPTDSLIDDFGFIDFINSRSHYNAKRLAIKFTKQGCHQIVSHVPGKGGYVRLSYKGKYKRINRYCWEFYKGPIPKDLCVCHKCDNRLCININHLFLGTITDNNRDKKAKGRGALNRGDDNGRARLTSSDIKLIKSSKARGILATQELAQRFGVSRGHIVRILSGRRWSHVRENNHV